MDRLCRRAAPRVLLCAALVLASLLGLCTATREFSEDEAWRYHYYIRAAYCDASPVDAWTCGSPCSNVPGFQTHTVLDNTFFKTSGFVGVDHGHSQIVVAFRGSVNFENWVEDLFALPVVYDSLSSCGTECTVHAGFAAAHLSLREDTRSAVLALLSAHPTYGIVVTGHALGGALATLAAADLQELLNRGNHTPAPQPITLYSYGSPRVGNVALAQWLTDLLSHGTHYRITHACDPVVHLPPMTWGYAHVPGEVFYGSLQRSSRVMCVDTVTEQDPKCSDDMLPLNVMDHIQYVGDTVYCDNGDSSDRTEGLILPWKVFLELLWEYIRRRL